MTDRMKEIANKSDRYLNCKSSSPKNLSDFFAIKDIFYLLSEVERLEEELACAWDSSSRAECKRLVAQGYGKAKVQLIKEVERLQQGLDSCELHAGDFAVECKRLKDENRRVNKQYRELIVSFGQSVDALDNAKKIINKKELCDVESCKSVKELKERYKEVKRLQKENEKMQVQINKIAGVVQKYIDSNSSNNWRRILRQTLKVALQDIKE